MPSRHSSLLWLLGLGLTSLVLTTSCKTTPATDTQHTDAQVDPWAHLDDTDDDSTAQLDEPLRAEDLKPVMRPVGEATTVPESFEVHFAVPVFTADQVGSVVSEETALSVVPPVAGKLVAASRNVLRFEPDAPLASQTEYALTLTSVYAKEGPITSNSSSWSHSFTTPSFKTLRATPTRVDFAKGRVSVELVFANAVDLDDVRAHSSVALDGRGVSATFERGSRANRVIAKLRDGRISGGGTFSVAINAGIKSLAGSATTTAFSDTFELDPEGKAIDIKSVHLVEGASRFAVEVVCDDNASEGNKRWIWLPQIEDSFRLSPRCLPLAASARELIHLDPPTDFSVVPTRGGFRIQGTRVARGPLNVRIDPGLQSVDGGTLLVERTTQLTVGPLEPTVSFTTSGRYLPRDAWQRLSVQHRNVQQLNVKVRQVPERNLVYWLTSDDESANNRVSDVILDTTVQVQGTPDVRGTSWIDVGSLLPGKKEGIYEVTVSGNGASAASRLLLTDLNLVAKASDLDPGGRLNVWALDMRSGGNEAGVLVQAIRASGSVVASCTTTPTGCAMVLPDEQVDDSHPVALIARRGDDLTYLKFDELETDVSEDKVQGEAYDSDLAYRASLWTERGVFRPGETAHIAGIVRDEDHVAPPANMPVDLQVRDPRGKLVRKLSVKTNDAGMFEVAIPFADYARTGRYRVDARAGKKALGQVSLSVEEFVPERMEVKATIAGANYLSTDPIMVDSQARYLFGGSAAEHRYEVTCKVEPTVFKPAKNTQYTYGQPTAGRRAVELGSASGTLGEEGIGALACPLLEHGGGLAGSGKLVANVAVFEAGSGRTTNTSTSTAVHPAPYYVGVATGTTKAQEGKPISVDGVVVDWAGDKVTSVSQVEVELMALESEWGYTYDQDRGHERWMRTLREVPLGRELVDVKNGAFKVNLTPQEGAERFQIVVRTELATTSLELQGDGGYWWWDDGERSKDVTPRPLRPTQVKVQLPDDIQVGKRTTATLTAPFKGRALITVETDKLLRKQWLDVEAGQLDWTFPRGEFADNVYVSALIIKDPHLESAGAFLPDRAFGVASVKVRPTAYTSPLTIDVAKQVRSDSKLVVNLDMGEGKGPRYATVAVVDEGILSLTNFQTPDPFDDLFPTRALGIRTWETVGWAMHLQAPGPSKSHGGDRESAAGGRVQMVKPVSLWSGLVEVGPDGKAKVEFDVPRYRGKLRVMAVASGTERMASAEADVIVRDPIVLQTTLPRFVTQGDEAQIPVFLTNMSGKDRIVDVRLKAEGLSLVGVRNMGKEESPLVFVGDNRTSVNLPDSESKTVVFRVKVRAPAGAVELSVVATSDDIEVSESLQVPIEANGPRERVVRTLPLDGNMDLDPLLTGWVEGSERTNVWVTNNPYGESFSHLSYVVRYPYGCIEQTTSSTRPLLYVGDLLRSSDPDLVAENKIEDMVKHGVDRIMNMQTPSGGFAYWMGGSTPTHWGTAYATHMLLDAKNAGFDVPEENLNDAIDWLDRELDSGDSNDRYDHGGPGGQAYMHYVLAKADKGNTAQMQGLLTDLGTPTTGADKEAVYLLKAGLYLAGDRRYEADLRNPDVSPVSTERRNNWSYYSDQRRRGFVLSVYGDLFGGQGEGGEKLARLVANALQGQPSGHYTTQEIVWGITGLGKFVQNGATDYKVDLVANGKNLPPDEWGAASDTLTWSLHRASELGDLDLRVTQSGKGRLYAVINSQGVRENGVYRYGGDGLSVKREYLDGTGRTINLDNVELGDMVYAKVTLKNTSVERVQNIALVDRLPAGWEIENPRLGRGGGADWLDDNKLWKTDNMNLRDDRLEVFGALNAGQEVQVVYGVRAVTAGTYTLPPVEAEAMYDPNVWTRAPGGTVKIHGPWKGFYL